MSIVHCSADTSGHTEWQKNVWNNVSPFLENLPWNVEGNVCYVENLVEVMTKYVHVVIIDQEIAFFDQDSTLRKRFSSTNKANSDVNCDL